MFPESPPSANGDAGRGTGPGSVATELNADWPIGRGTFVSDDKSLVVWIGGDDHIKVVVESGVSVAAGETNCKIASRQKQWRSYVILLLSLDMAIDTVIVYCKIKHAKRPIKR